MYEQENIRAIVVYMWETDHSCTHVFFFDDMVYCSDAGGLALNLGEPDI